MEDVHEAVRQNDTLAFRLIQLRIVLDSGKPLPRQTLSKIYREVKKDLVTARLVQIMVLHRLYMFKTSERDMQSLASEFGFDIGKTHAIGYQMHNKLPA